MDEKQNEVNEVNENNAVQLEKWFSTYGVITAERILGRYQIKLPQDELLNAIKNPFSFYHKLLEIPLKNIFNGIVLQQANDYHLYAQKLFIDYLLSGESGKDPEAQGASTRSSLEDERQMLVTLGEEYHQIQLKHDALIASSQQILIKTTKDFNQVVETTMNQISVTLKNAGFPLKKSQIKHGITHALIHTDFIKNEAVSNKLLFVDVFSEVIKTSLTDGLKEKILNNMQDLLEILLAFNSLMEPFDQQVKEMAELARSFRTQFYDTIIRVTELIQLLPEYKIDPIQDKINREPLYFDKSIGEQ